MAGYDYKFVEAVSREYKCKKCSLVAKKATLTDCCGETFCESCISGTVDQKEPCPHCGQKQFQLFSQVKYQQRIDGLQVFCSMKERGCDWTGRLDQLATHLDPDLNNCQFVDEKCPLYCGTVVPRNMLEEHVTSECVKREHFCRYCSYKASYEEIEDEHILVCEYVPLQCPNRCGVTSEREHMDDHLKMCPLQEITCNFSNVGCEDRFTPEDQEEHNRENIQNHLSMVSHAQQKYQEAMRERLEQEWERRFEQELVNIKDVAGKKNKNFDAQEEKLIVQEAKLEDLKKTSAAMLENFVQLEERTKVEHARLKQKNADMVKILGITIFLASLIIAVILFRVFNYENKTILLERQIEQQTRNLSMFRNGFVMTHFSAKRSAGGSWTSPAMYTHVGGYKFVLHVYASGTKKHPFGVRLSCQIVTGEFDNDLPWPFSFAVSPQVVDLKGNPSNTTFRLTKWERPKAANSDTDFLGFHDCDDQGNVESFWGSYFLCHSQVKYFLLDDKLYFKVIVMVL